MSTASLILPLFLLITSALTFGCKQAAIDAQSHITTESNETWNVKIANPLADQFREIYAIEDNGLLISGNFEKTGFELFKTTVEYGEWEKFAKVEGKRIINLHFFDIDRAVMILTDDGQQHSRTIMRTENGGRDWETTYNAENVSFGSMEKGEPGTGIILGSPDAGRYPKELKTLVLVTRDFGKTWADMSGRIQSQLNVTKSGRSETLDLIIGRPDNTFAAMTSSGRIFKTTDQGNSWKLMPHSAEHITKIFPSEFGKFENCRFWVMERQNAMENRTAAISSQRTDGVWERYNLEGHYFLQVIAISGDEFMAEAFPSDGTINPAIPKNGIILYSKNRGKEWSVVYKNDKPEPFGQMHKVSRDNVLILRRDSNIVELTRRARADNP